MNPYKADIIQSDSFDILYTKYKSHFVGIAMSYVRDRMAAEDIVTEAFIAYWENREGTVEIKSAPAYIMKTIKNRCLNWLQAYRQHSEAHQDISSTAYRMNEMNIVSCKADESHSLYIQEVSSIIERVLSNMPERTRRVFIAHRYKDMTYKEISKLYSISEGQVQYELRCAKNALKTALKDYSPIIILIFIGF